MLLLVAGLVVGSAAMLGAVPVFIRAPSPGPHLGATVIGVAGLTIVTVSSVTMYAGGSASSPVIEMDALSFFGLTYLGFSAVFWGDLGLGSWPPRWLDE